MDHLERAVREAVAREVAPLIADCEQMRAELDRMPIILDKRKLAATRLLRVRIECQLAELRGVEDRVVRLAKERFPQWRI